MTDSSLASLLFLQIACILAVCRGLGWIASRVRQPQVIAEMVAGFLLGPSLLGWLAPGVQSRLFPVEARSVLFVTSQIGLVLYMFCVGLEFRVDLVARYRRRALTVSAAGIAVPFVLGATLALLMLARDGLRGLITTTLFTILVLMALGTTLMTGPLFSLVWERESDVVAISAGQEQPASNQ